MKKFYFSIKSLAPFVFFFALSILCFEKSYSQVTRIFTSLGTFTVPAGVTSIQVEAWGGVGSATGSANNASAGGGSGM
jgi:hypothetical protein